MAGPLISSFTFVLLKNSVSQSDQPHRVIDQNSLPMLGVRHEAGEGIEERSVVRHARFLEDAGVRPIAAPDQPVGGDLRQRLHERRDIVVREGAPGYAVEAAYLEPEVR